MLSFCSSFFKVSYMTKNLIQLLLLLPAVSILAQTSPPRLIVRADDMGYAHAGNEAILKCFEVGIATSVEVIAPSPWFPLKIIIDPERHLSRGLVDLYQVRLRQVTEQRRRTTKVRPRTCRRVIEGTLAGTFSLRWRRATLLVACRRDCHGGKD
jgi:hypothetical protein